MRRVHSDLNLLGLKCMAAQGSCRQFIDAVYAGDVDAGEPWLQMKYVESEDDFKITPLEHLITDMSAETVRKMRQCEDLRLSDVVAAACVDVSDVSSGTVLQQTVIILAPFIARIVLPDVSYESCFDAATLSESNPRKRKMWSRAQHTNDSGSPPPVSREAKLVLEAYLMKWPERQG